MGRIIEFNRALALASTVVFLVIVAVSHLLEPAATTNVNINQAVIVSAHTKDLPAE